jgi:uncharacterized DUF497 family protein
MDFNIVFSEEKNQLLKSTRGVSFDEVVDCLRGDDLIADVMHPSSERPHQRLYIVKIKNYAFAVPYVFNEENKVIYLKTVYPSRKYTKLYIQGEKL